MIDPMTTQQPQDHPDRLLQAGMLAHQSGDIEMAQQHYLSVLRVHPHQPDALNLLGVADCQLGEYTRGAELIRRAITSKPEVADYHLNLGNALRALGHYDQAADALHTSLQLRPDDLNALVNLGLTLREAGQLDASISVFQKAVALDRGTDSLIHLGTAQLLSGNGVAAIAAYYDAATRNPALPEAYLGLAEAHQSLGNRVETISALSQVLALAPEHRIAALRMGEALLGQGEVEAGLTHFQSLVESHPGDADAQLGLGMALASAQRNEEARDRLQEAVRLNPKSQHAWINLGNVLYELNDPEASANAFLNAIDLQPDFAPAYANLAKVLMETDRLPESLASSEQALRFDPNFDATWSLRGTTLLRSGDAQGAAECFHRALELSPSAERHSKYASTLSYVEAKDSARILAAHLDYGRHFPAWDGPRHVNDPNPQRRLRVGYVSPDLRQHSVAYFLDPVLRAHDRSGFEIVAYQTHTHSDAMTEQLRGHCDVWVDATALSDAALADRICADRIDILVDLAGHSTAHRLPVFAAKPAPVQITWLGYLTTAGLAAIDYRITDAKVDPDGYEAWQVEKPVRLPGSYLCYAPSAKAPEVSALPARTTGSITFGSFNNLAKISPACVALWARVLQSVPGSRLLIKSKALDHESVRNVLLAAFADQGIDRDRLLIAGWEATTHDHLDAYRQVDIAFDTFPYNGVTTTCEALWMGVPVLSLVGDTHTARQGLSLLGSVGLDEFACADITAFAARAQSLAHDLPALESLRARLRQRMADSPLTDAACFTRNLEQAYRQAWAGWCAQAQSEA